MTRDRLLLSICRSATAGLACAASVSATAAPRALVSKSAAAAKISVYDSLCDEDNAVECMIAEIGCESPGEFTATVYALSSQEAASVFGKANGKGSVAAGASGRSLQVSRVALSPFTYKWDVTLISLEKAGEVWSLVWNADAVQLQAGARKVALRRSDINEAAFRDVVSVCASGPR